MCSMSYHFGLSTGRITNTELACAIISLAQLMVQCAQIVKWPALSITIDAEEKNESQWNIVGFNFFLFFHLIVLFVAVLSLAVYSLVWIWSVKRTSLSRIFSFFSLAYACCLHIYIYMCIRIYIWNWLSVSLANRWHISKY